MRALPPLTLTLTNHRTWNAAVGALAALGVGATVAWAATWWPSLRAAHLVGLAAALAAIVGLAAGALLRGPQHLRWTGEGWTFGDPPRPADCRLALDLGPWLLLRCRTAGAVTWLPLARRHLGADWHALRCAVHAPKPGPARPDAGSDGR